MSEKNTNQAPNADEDITIQKCESCGEEMEFWNRSKTEMNGGEESLDDEAEIFIAWSPNDCDKAAFFWCEGCEILQVSHRKCDTPMQLTGHQGFSRGGSQNYRDGKTGMKSVLTNPKPTDPNMPRFDVSDLMQTKLRLSEWFPCGFNGDQCHFWMCPECDASLAFCSKH